MRFFSEATEKEKEKAFINIKKIIYENKKRFHHTYSGSYSYRVCCPCEYCSWYAYIPDKFKIKDIRSVLRKFISHFTAKNNSSPDYEHLKLIEDIFGKEMAIIEAEEIKSKLTSKLNEANKFLFLSQQ